jgi:hypothetical protein
LSPGFRLEASSTMFKIGTGKKRPPVVCILFAQLNASALFIKPDRGLKYPLPIITAFAAAAEQTIIEGKALDSSNRASL